MKDIREIVGSPSIETTGIIRIDGGKEYNAHIRIDFEHGRLTFSPLSSDSVFKFEPELESPKIIECILLSGHFTPTGYTSTMSQHNYIHLFRPRLDRSSRIFAGNLVRYQFLFGLYAPRINPSEAQLNKAELTFPHIEALIGTHSKFPTLSYGGDPLLSYAGGPITIPDAESAVCSWTSEGQTVSIVLLRGVAVSEESGICGDSISIDSPVSAYVEIDSGEFDPFKDSTFVTNRITPFAYLVSILAKSRIEIDEPTLIIENSNNIEEHRIDYFNLLPAPPQASESHPHVMQNLYNAFLQKEATERFFSESMSSEFIFSTILKALSPESDAQNTFFSLVTVYENLGRQHFHIKGRRNALLRSLQKIFDNTKHYIDWNYDVVCDDILKRIALTRHGYAHANITQLDKFVADHVTPIQSALLHILVLYILLRAGFTTDFIARTVWGTPPPFLKLTR